MAGLNIFSIGRSTFMALLVVATAFAGCGGGDEEGPIGPKYPDEASFCTALAEAECSGAVMQACYGSEGADLAKDRTTCKSVRMDVCNPAGLKYDPTNAEGCIGKRGSILNDAKLTSDELKEAQESCLSVFTKKGADGTDCTTDTDCDVSAGLRCVVKLSSPTGICLKPNPVTGGKACDQPADQCVEGFYCDGSNCLEKLDLDKDCSTGQPCQEDLRCLGGKCTAKLENGTACTSDVECASSFCSKATGAAAGTCVGTNQLHTTSSSCDEFR